MQTSSANLCKTERSALPWDSKVRPTLSRASLPLSTALSRRSSKDSSRRMRLLATVLLGDGSCEVVWIVCRVCPPAFADSRTEFDQNATVKMQTRNQLNKRGLKLPLPHTGDINNSSNIVLGRHQTTFASVKVTLQREPR